MTEDEQHLQIIEGADGDYCLLDRTHVYVVRPDPNAELRRAWSELLATLAATLPGRLCLLAVKTCVAGLANVLCRLGWHSYTDRVFPQYPGHFVVRACANCEHAKDVFDMRPRK